jgi:hypothetical protein
VKRVRSIPALLLTYAGAALLLACGKSDGGAPGGTIAPDATLATPAGAGAAAPEPERVRCSAPPGASPAPRSIAQMMELVNALPKPLSLACLVESLERPIELYATRSVISAQPAEGTRSPRIFLFEDPLIMSVAPAGPGGHLLELGELRSENSSLKGELEFPIAEALGPEAPYERIVFDEERTGCAFCHRSEKQAPDITFTRAYISQALRPVPKERVSLESLEREQGACDPAAEPERCALLEALLEPGDVLERDFPPELETFL